MVENLVAISETFAGNDALLDQALVELAQLSQGFDGILDRSADDLAGAIDHLAALTGTAADDVDGLERALHGLPGVFEALPPTVSAGPWLRMSVRLPTVLPGSHAARRVGHGWVRPS